MTEIKEYKIQDVTSCYENYKLKINGKWVFITPEKLKEIVKNISVKGTITKKRTRVWFE